jgi:hypothetical protein
VTARSATRPEASIRPSPYTTSLMRAAVYVLGRSHRFGCPRGDLNRWPMSSEIPKIDGYGI